ncbi:MAG: hypothetical protein WC755_03150 [Candidatus Woesearchaeota archaeon]|jgi:hypothetical protein
MTSKRREKMLSDIEGLTAMLREGNVSLILDSYDDLFSDFDPRHYSEKALSDDFLMECRKATRDKIQENGLELRLLVPKEKRNLADEETIKRRLKNHFEKHFHEKQREHKEKKKRGIMWIILGAIFLTFSALLLKKEGLVFSLLFVILDPAGWFTMWTGFDLLFFDVKETQPEYDFYKKMSNLNIYFYSY